MVKYFKKSGPAMNLLVKAQNQLGIRELKLLQNVKIRWNSDFFMFNRILELKKPLCTILPELKEIDILSTSEWKILEELFVVLDIFEDSTRLI